ncbi:hypothetical protein I5677_12875 [Mobilitalea sibirica]|uniref:DUF5658 domain-containing protein n=1 Tax=Mobilitalea sibirica TaxID=1462919 RepID=A0A8J7H5R0_9FIRM|nr:DUF5658 family protein [Mobilitalea sibirica]MBH1941789.1 hypothetical protein [Mobilitalea sibirica]
MIAFIKNSTLDSIKKKLFILYLLNVTDIIFTLLLLQTGYFAEVNILMVNAVKSPFASFMLKIILPALLLYYLYRKICISDTSQLRAANIGINISLTLYTLVNLSHLVWTALLPVFMRMNY